MKPLLVLIGTFLLTAVITKAATDQWDWILVGNAAMSAMLLFTAIGHFAFTKGMTMVMPGFVPFKKHWFT